MKAIVKYSLAGVLIAALCTGVAFLYRNVRFLNLGRRRLCRFLHRIITY